MALMKEQKEPSSLSLPRDGLGKASLGWEQGFKGTKVLVPGNLTFPPEEKLSGMELFVTRPCD